MDAMTDETSNPIQYKMPDIESLDLGKVELYYDVDLDHLTILFNGSDRFISHRERGLHSYLLVDPAARAIAGIEYFDFMKVVVPLNPKLLDALPFATVISGDSQVTAVQARNAVERQQLRDQAKIVLRYIVNWRDDDSVSEENSDIGAFQQLTA